MYLSILKVHVPICDKFNHIGNSKYTTVMTIILLLYSWNFDFKMPAFLHHKFELTGFVENQLNNCLPFYLGYCQVHRNYHQFAPMVLTCVMNINRQ